jgi:hypothetical protein
MGLGCDSCGVVIVYGDYIHVHEYDHDNDGHHDLGDSDSDYDLLSGFRGGVFRAFGGLLRDLLGLGLTLTTSIGVLSFVNLLINLSVVFLVHPLSLVSLLKYFSASLTATSYVFDLGLKYA